MSTDILKSHLNSVLSRIDSKKTENGGDKVKPSKAGRNSKNSGKSHKSRIDEARHDLEVKEKKKSKIIYFYKTGMPQTKPSKKALARRIKSLKK